jgi:hypothetical protein
VQQKRKINFADTVYAGLASGQGNLLTERISIKSPMQHKRPSHTD